MHARLGPDPDQKELVFGHSQPPNTSGPFAAFGSVPAGHVLHDEARAAEYWPDRQGVHVIDLVGENVPKGQSAQPIPLTYRPASQS